MQSPSASRIRHVGNQATVSLRRRLLQWLERPAPGYRRFIYNDIKRLKKVIRPGDVVLVEGRSRMARIIKLFSSSHWSHVAMYVGDRPLNQADPRALELARHHGDEARHLLVEAFSGRGVIYSPLATYRRENIRVCRPYGIAPNDLDQVVAAVMNAVGDRYDDQNIIDIAWMVLAGLLAPGLRRSAAACLGNCNDYQVICSGLIARSFQQVGYPIVPELAGRRPDDRCNPYGSQLIMRHYSQILPRDFDLSPNFEVIKYNLVGTAFDYKAMWRRRPGQTDQPG